jgi:hypothetical protein
MNRVYNSGNHALCRTLSKGLTISLSGSIPASTKGTALTIPLSRSIPASSKGTSLIILGFNFVNQLTTFQSLFGITSYQSSTEIYIKKAELSGLTPNANNSAESLVIALLLLWARYAKGKIDGKVSVDRWSVYLANEKVRYVLEANFYRKLTVISNEIQDISDTLTPSDF